MYKENNYIDFIKVGQKMIFITILTIVMIIMIMHQHGDHDIHHYHHDHAVGQASWWVTMNGCKLYDADDRHH